jgi:hypothetical protein
LAERSVRVVVFNSLKIVGTDFKFIQYGELIQRGKLGNLSSAKFVEDDLEHTGNVPSAFKRDNEKITAF